jgi:sugar/nucleoside kinase (ribokinase family)
VSLDPNWDPAETWDQGLSALYGLLDVLLPNETEAAALARALPPDRGGRGTGVMTAAEAARALAGQGPSAVVKLGAEGALAASPDGELIRVPAVPDVHPVDAVGAGDSFDAGFLAATLWGWDTSRALAVGAACGALSTRAAGGTGAQATREEAIALASGLPGGIPADR